MQTITDLSAALAWEGLGKEALRTKLSLKRSKRLMGCERSKGRQGEPLVGEENKGRADLLEGEIRNYTLPHSTAVFISNSHSPCPSSLLELQPAQRGSPTLCTPECRAKLSDLLWFDSEAEVGQQFQPRAMLHCVMLQLRSVLV